MPNKVAIAAALRRAGTVDRQNSIKFRRKTIAKVTNPPLLGAGKAHDVQLAIPKGIQTRNALVISIGKILGEKVKDMNEVAVFKKYQKILGSQDQHGIVRRYWSHEIAAARRKINQEKMLKIRYLSSLKYKRRASKVKKKI